MANMLQPALFTMLYENGSDVELLEKKGGNLADRVKLILPGGNVEQGITMPDTSISYHTAHGSSKQWVKSSYFQFDSTRFPWNSDKKSKVQTDYEDGVVEIGLKFATNVTTRAHNKRRFMWRVDLKIFSRDGKVLAEHTTTSPPFAYLPRNPEKSAMDFRLDDVISEGSPGDLVMCGGAGLGSKERPQLIARLRSNKGKEYTLERSQNTKSTFVTRLPIDILPGLYMLQLVNEDTEEVSEEVKTKIVQRQRDNFDLVELAQQLDEGELREPRHSRESQHCSYGSNFSDEDSPEQRDSPELHSRSHSFVDLADRME